MAAIKEHRAAFHKSFMIFQAHDWMLVLCQKKNRRGKKLTLLPPFMGNDPLLMSKRQTETCYCLYFIVYKHKTFELCFSLHNVGVVSPFHS